MLKTEGSTPQIVGRQSKPKIEARKRLDDALKLKVDGEKEARRYELLVNT